MPTVLQHPRYTQPQPVRSWITVVSFIGQLQNPRGKYTTSPHFMARSRSNSLRLSRQSTTDSRPVEAEGDGSPPISQDGDVQRRSESIESNERSPLLSPKGGEDSRSFLSNGTPAGSLQVEYEAEQKSKSVFYLILLTLSIAGWEHNRNYRSEDANCPLKLTIPLRLQIAWGVEMSSGTVRMSLDIALRPS